MIKNPEVDAYLADGCGRCELYKTLQCKTVKWIEELTLLRNIVLECGLKEEVKWGVPCYTFKKKNIILLHGFKDYCAIMFINGSLLSDPENILIRQTENVQGGRQVRFTGIKEIPKLEATLKAYVFEAIEAEKAGVKVVYKKTEEYPVPEELTAVFRKNAALKKAFSELTPGRQRGFLLHFAAPKQSATRTARIEKCAPLIFAGKGLHDDYHALVKKNKKV